jgi:hypothetical protein
MKCLFSAFFSIATISILSTPSQAQVISGFQGPYDPANWVLSTNLNGFVNTTGAPSSIILTGTNTPTGDWPGNTDYVTTSKGPGNVSFVWNYSSTDTDNWDQFYYLLNGVQTFLAQNNSQGTGNTVFSVLQGDTFGYRVFTGDGLFGPGVATISNFSAPVPGPLPVLGAAAAFSFSRRLRQRIHGA